MRRGDQGSNPVHQSQDVPTKSKAIALAGGITGLAGGIMLIFGPMLLVGGAVANVGTRSLSGTTGVSAFLTLIKIAVLALGIFGLLYYRGTGLVKTAGHILLIVGGAVAIIPLLGWVGGIVAIVGGALYLSSLKNFKAA